MVGRVLITAALMAPLGCGTPSPAAPALHNTEAGSAELDATALMRQVVAKYRSLRSYEDEGVVLTYSAHQDRLDELHFATAYRAPGDFRFDWVKHHPSPKLRHVERRYIAWANHQGAFTYWDTRGIRNEPSLFMAIAASTGVSKGAITSIAGLLFESGEMLWSIEDWRALALLEPAVFEGVPCLRISSDVGRQGHRAELWIGRDDLLIRRIVKMTVDTPSGRRQPRSEEIRRQVRFDHDVPDGRFDFTP